MKGYCKKDKKKLFFKGASNKFLPTKACLLSVKIEIDRSSSFNPLDGLNIVNYF